MVLHISVFINVKGNLFIYGAKMNNIYVICAKPANFNRYPLISFEPNLSGHTFFLNLLSFQYVTPLGSHVS
jgi:hypothetical protein